MKVSFELKKESGEDSIVRSFEKLILAHGEYHLFDKKEDCPNNFLNVPVRYVISMVVEEE